MSRNLYDAQESLSFLEILYRANRVYLWCAFTYNHIFVLVRSMNTQRNAARRLEEEVPNAGAPLHDQQVPPLEENANVDQAPAKPQLMTEVKMGAIIAQMDQSMTTQAQAVDTQA